MSGYFSVTPGEGLSQVLHRASAYLNERGVENASVDAQLLLAHLLSRTSGETVSRGRVQSLALIGESLPESCAQPLVEMVEERGRRVPLQHITGQAHFRHLTLQVGPGVFIPRPETELLVDRVLERVVLLRKTGEKRRLKIADLCTGSGAIAAAIATELENVEVSAVELSPLAYAWAEENLRNTGVRLVLGDATVAFEGEEESYDIVVSNPPYIPTGAVPKDPEVREHDPELALYGGSDDGMRIPAAITRRAVELLKPGGYFICEHAESQKQVMVEVLSGAGFSDIESINDLAERPRHTCGVKQSAREEIE